MEKYHLSGGQIRRVDEMEFDDKGKTCVRYFAKSGRTPQQSF